MSNQSLLQRLRERWSGNHEETITDEATEHSFSFAAGTEGGWHRCTISPAKGTYEEETCHDGGPPTCHALYRYTVKDSAVFAELLEQKDVNYNGTTFEVVDGKVLETDIRRRTSFEWAVAMLDDQIAELQRQVSLHQIVGELRYCILSLHGWTRRDFAQERSRIASQFHALTAKAKTIGATRDPGGYFKPSDDAGQTVASAVEALHKPESLAVYGFTFPEVIRYEPILETLDRLSQDNR